MTGTTNGDHGYEARVAAWKATRDAGIPSEWILPEHLHPLPKNVTSIPRKSGILDDTELDIIELTAVKLRDAMAAGVYTAVECTIAYCKVAVIAQQVTNCLTSVFVDDAVKQAQKLDEEYQRTGQVVGPLHGVPVSIKDHINIKGTDAPSGYLALYGKMVANEDAQMVGILRDAGAVFYVKTSNPQSLMHLETDCALGPTTCPHNTDLTSGGSSGGEGALLAMKGSALGIGTDIGGSIRSPAAACGVYSFKPSVGRLPPTGCNMPVGPTGYEGIICTHGPMGRSPEDLELYMRLVADSKPWIKDPFLHVKPWRELPPMNRPLRIGILRSDGVVKPVASIERALQHVIRKLSQSADIELVDYTPMDGTLAWNLISKLYWPDKGKMVYDYCAASGEPVLPLTEWIIGHTKDTTGTLEESLELVTRRDSFRAAMAKHWHEHGIDVLLSPVGPTPAPGIGTAKYWNYTSFWNLVNYPAAVFPTGLYVDPTLDEELYESSNDHEDWIKQTYSATASAGAPLCLQVIGYIGHEEETMAGFKRILSCVV